MKTIQPLLITLAAFAASCGMQSYSHSGVKNSASDTKENLNLKIQDLNNDYLPIGSLFEKEPELDVLVIEVSNFSCGACRTLATSLKEDQFWKSTFASKKCNYISLVGDNHHQWASKFGKEHTYYLSNITILNAYGPGKTYKIMPNIFVLDRHGNILADEPGANPTTAFKTKLTNLCSKDTVAKN